MLRVASTLKNIRTHKAVHTSTPRVFSDAAAATETFKPKRLICRPTSNLKVGIVGLPNIGKSMIFNAISMQNVPSENYPFCTIDPNHATVAVYDPRITWLKNLYNPSLVMNSILNITDIAGIVSGAHEGKGLGNAFLSHIAAVDALFHLVRVFPNKSTGKQVEHVEGGINPIRDMEIISNELLKKDQALIEVALQKATKAAKSSSDPKKHTFLNACKKAQALILQGIDVREGDWTAEEADALIEVGLLSSKPIVYLLNGSIEQYMSQYTEELEEVRAWIQKRSPGSASILFSADLEADLQLMEEEERAEYIKDLAADIPVHPNAQPLAHFGGLEPNFLQKEALKVSEETKSMIPAIVSTGFSALHLIQYFTCGPVEVRSWTIRNGMTAPEAAGVIHTDFEKNFVAAEVISYADLVELGSEDAVKKNGKLKTQGKGYIMQDGDVVHFKHTAKK